MVAIVPVPKISYFTLLGLNGAGSFTRPAPGRVSSVFPKTPRSRSTMNMASNTTATIISGTQTRLSTFSTGSLAAQTPG